MKPSAPLLSTHEKIHTLWHELCQNFRAYNKKSTLDRLQSAFEFAQNVHKEQTRESGEPYILHPLEVALILTDYSADLDTLMAALLHDTLEESKDVTFERLKSEFGETVAQLVLGVTNIESILPENTMDTKFFREERDIETIRRIFQKSKQDIRVILIKLADRLHNIQTLSGKKDAEKRREKAEETLMIFVPVAERLGIWKLKQQLESTCLPHLYPTESASIEKFLSETALQRKSILEEVTETLTSHDKKHTIQAIVPYERSVISLKRAFNEKGKLHINDNLILEIMVEREEACYLILSLIHKIWKTRAKEADFISNPRDNGYQAYHTEIITPKGNRVRIRIVTKKMHLRNWYGITYDYFQKKQGSSVHFLMPFEFIDRKTEGKSSEFLQAARTDLLQRKINVHMKGKTVDIPLSATALDFVFYAFGKKALRTSKIFLNDRDIPFDTILKESDIIEVKFSETPTVAFDWFNFVKTATARIAIRTALQQWKYEKRVELGKMILQKAFDLHEKGRVESFFGKHHTQVLSHFRVKNVEELYSLLADGSIKDYEVFRMCFPEVQERLWHKFWRLGDTLLEKIFWKREKNTLRLKIDGLLDPKINPLTTIHHIRHELKIHVLKSSLQENTKNNTFSLKINAASEDPLAFHKFILELEKKPGIVRVVPLLSFQKQQIFLFWILLTCLLWIALPNFLRKTQHLTDNFSSVLKTLFIYCNIIPMIVVNHSFYSFMRSYFSQLRNTSWLVLIAILFNLIGISLFSWQSFVYGFNINLFLISTIFFCITFIFFYNYLTQNLTYSQQLAAESTMIATRKGKKILAYFLGFLSACIWGINAIMIRQLVHDGENVFFTVWARLMMGGIFLLVISFFDRIFFKRRHRVEKIQYNRYFWLMVIGLVGNFLLYHAGMQFTLASNAIIIENFSSIVVLLAVGLFTPYVAREIGQSKRDILKMIGAVFIGSIGASLVFSYFPSNLVADYRTKLFGDFIEIFAMVFFAIFVMSSNLYMKQQGVQSLRVTSQVLLLGSIVFSPLVLSQPIPRLTSEEWIWMSTIGIVSTGLAYTFWNIASKTLPVIPASLLLNFRVMVTLAIEYWFFGLQLGISMLLGVALIIFASIMAEKLSSKRLFFTEKKRY